VNINEFYGLNKEEKVDDFLSTTGGDIEIKIVNNEDRLSFLMEMMKQEKTAPMMNNLADFFIRICNKMFEFDPDKTQIEEYVKYMATSDSGSMARFNKEQILKRTAQYLVKRISK